MPSKFPRYLPAAPLLPWIKEELERVPMEIFAERCGISDKRIRDVLSGRTQRLMFESVDKMITYGSHNFCDFYPEYDDDELFYSLNERMEIIEPKRVCEIEGCSRALHAKGMCHHHYRKSKAAA